MPEPIDHAAESDKVWEHLGESIIAIEGITDATIVATSIDALRHAVLELAAQQKAANIIAMMGGIIQPSTLGDAQKMTEYVNKVVFR